MGPIRWSSRFTRWKDVDASEMKIFLGLLLHMGPYTLPTIDRYWNTDTFYKTTFWSSIMSRNRFQLILRFLHFADNSGDSNDRLYKIRPDLNHFNKTMREKYVPDRNLSIDESMVLWRGRLVFRQYAKNKKHKYGVKFYELCESDGMILRIKIYCGKSETVTEMGHAADVVFELMEDYLDKGYKLFTDNYYNSVSLTKQFTGRETYICKTLRSNRKENSKDLVNKKLKKRFCVIFQSNQMLSYYSALRKTIRWPKKLFLHILEMFIHNAHLLFRKATNSDIRTLKFREAFIAALIGDKMPKKSIMPNRRETFHYLEAIPPTEKKARPTKPCRVCTAEKLRRETRYFCPVCEVKPALCVEECLKKYHV
ncbi:hypothetical protein NQ314_010028 [Rhamnusium bicolor]|uniref:PiggyBac transposable element-derived protein domain-containing protein n=1 Tax=Rhamnusium bicolor TaxID=1586634 RepID=A0AAV8XVB5_9CUCU|nr:hypothetical protein NQ314_010028 [Rhamnusium bicolor]